MAEQQEQKKDSLQSYLQSFKGSPTQEQIDKWKVQYGEVFVSGFSENELYVWRAITRPEWVDLQSLTNNPEAKMTQYKFEEMLCDICVLWKSVSKSWVEGKAGTASSLHEQILQNSNFLSAQAASYLVAKL